MLSVKVVKSPTSGLSEVRLYKDGAHHLTVDETLNDEQAENVRYHIQYMFERLNYLEPLQEKFEAIVGEPDSDPMAQMYESLKVFRGQIVIGATSKEMIADKLYHERYLVRNASDKLIDTIEKFTAKVG